ncbi:MAG TPA: hypothetical protein VGR92_14835 [Steroidobacteraceae bacterium]|nr:hypothetical protein [Steroidobacteraceae bacterium]
MTEFDDTLTRLFAEAQETLPEEDFLRNVTVRMTHARRRRAIRQAALVTAAAGLAVVVTPYVAEGSLTVASHLGVWLPALGNALASPVCLACTLAIAAWRVRRTRSM